MTYKRLKHYTSFTAPFDFSKLIANLPFCDSDENNAYVINGKKVKSFFIEYQRHCEDNNIEYDETSEYFAEYLISRGSLKDGITKDRVKNIVQKKWAEILVRFGIFEKMDSIMSNCKIGIIEVQGFKPADSQKIFYIINSEGVKLTAAEILSAKSYWNKKIQNPSAEMVSATNTLYTAMGIRVEDVYRWDIPATLLERLGDNVVFQKLSWDSINKKTEFEKKLTLGFKTMAGVYKKAVTKEHLDEMGRDNSIDWSIEAENTIKDLKAVIKLIEETTYFRYLKTWKTSIMELTSDAIALDFILIMYFDYIRKEKPYGAGTRTKQFQRNCFILWDSLIYEYVRKMWRGSSDSLIANNIRELSNKGDVFSPVEKEKWIDLLQEIYERSTVNETNVSVSLMKPILYHMYCLQNIAGPNDMGVTVEVDHIIPQSEFKSSTIPNKDVIKDNLYNLGLLPKKENVSKSNHKLKHIDDEWLISQIETYEFVEQNMFEEFSSVSGYKGLFEYKKKKFDEAFGTMEEGNRSKRDVQLID